MHRPLLRVSAIALAIGTLPLCAASARAADAEAETDGGDSIIVIGEKQPTEASSGTKTTTPLVETPQSISVIGADTISQLGIQNLNQALRFVAGVTPEQRGSSAEVYDQFKLRGFDAPRYLDGLRVYDSPTGYASTQVDVSRVDRYEIIKGPASVLYGQSSPGGLVAISSKLPLQRDLYGSVAGTYGNYDLYRVDADLGGRSGHVAWRLYGSANGADTQQDFGKRRRQTVSGAVTLFGDTHTSFTVLAAYSHDPYNGNYGVFPASGTLYANPNGRVPNHFYGGEPDDRFKREQAGITYIFNHEFGDGGWAFRSSGRYQYVSSALGIYYISGFPIDPAQQVVGRASYATRERLNAWTMDNQLAGKLTTGPIEHTLLFGADRQVLHGFENFAFGGATPINVYNPVYGTTPTIRPGDVDAVPDSPFGPTVPGTLRPHLRQQGIYAQDQLALGGLRLTLSGRYDWARSGEAGSEQKDEKFTYRAGLLYLTDSGLAPYVSYSTSFEPQIALISDSLGAPTRQADPSSGKQIEGGLKYQPPGTQILVTASVFRITQSNVVSSSPIGFSTQSGRVRSKGVEFEAAVPLPYDFNARIAVSRQSVKIVDDANAANIGLGLFSVGKGNATAFLAWAPKDGPLAGLSIGGDVRHVMKPYATQGLFTPVENLGGIRSPSYTLFDALLGYDLGKMSPGLDGLKLQVNASNIFDKRHVTSCYLDYVGWCWYGNRRTVQGTVSYTF